MPYSLKSETNFDANGAGNPGSFTSLADQSKVQAVPEIDSKIGLAYSIPFNSGSSLSIEGGYMVAAYFNAINQVTPTGTVHDNGNDTFSKGIVALTGSTQTQSDLDLNGPYVRLAWKF